MPDDAATDVPEDAATDVPDDAVAGDAMSVAAAAATKTVPARLLIIEPPKVE
ncbi:hypothetical protein ITP53_09305 [Nonomuraea sp. K274]|uniref:Uncharacterized protein n=1 Tax=Nonomuraea cypriaca TaxID=1187855 RepID=A0A931A6A8_9ACTN|nr:hypothetical protein [Nonomuraea cypriaca]MBF8185938.1 hypothetical protein [Nonomuraea cypriaca]